jgi:hypothetical protein
MNNNDNDKRINPMDLLEGEVALLLENHSISDMLAVTAKLYLDVSHSTECDGCATKARWLYGKLTALEAEIDLFGGFPQVGGSDCEPETELA